MPTSITRECSNSVLHLGQIRIQVGICHLERVTAKKLESIHTTEGTVPIERTKKQSGLMRSRTESTFKVLLLPTAKIPEGISLKASSRSLKT
jgi:hypothetical protein